MNPNVFAPTELTVHTFDPVPVPPNPDPAKAKAVAEDVLKHLEAYRWHPGIYFSGYSKDEFLPGDDLQRHADKAMQECVVCALGGCLISKARCFNAVPLKTFFAPSTDVQAARWGRMAGRDEIVASLTDVFHPVQLDMIETAFEGRNMNFTTHNDGWKLCQHAWKYTFACTSPAERIRLVVENIIANEGQFDPWRPPQPKEEVPA